MAQSAPYRAWAAWLRIRMGELNLPVGHLADATGIKEATLRSYRAGQRRPTSQEKLRVLAKALRLPGETLAVTVALMESTVEESSRPKDFHQQLDSDSAVLRTMTLTYGPFADARRENGFVDRLFDLFFKLSAIRNEPTGIERRFQLQERLDGLDSDEYQIATNLLGTLQRLKKCTFYWIPIRVSLGAVCLRRHVHSLKQISEALVGRDPHRRSGSTVWPIVVEHEVGAVHVQQTLGMQLSEDPRHFVDDLDTAKLAARLREEDAGLGRIACTVTDEITALGVARDLGDSALIVFPLTTTQSVLTSPWRRELPAHMLGAAISRKNRLLKEYLDDAWPAMLQLEKEVIASSYMQLYCDLTEYVTSCLDAGPLVADTSGMAVDLSAEQGQRELFIHRAARAYARRALQIDQRSIGAWQLDGSPWRNILERTREKVLAHEADDRLRVRQRVRAVVNEALGEGIGERELTRADARNVQPLLEQEFDVELGGGLRGPGKIWTIERLTSVVQRAMELSSPVMLHATVSLAQDHRQKAVEELREALRRELSQDDDPAVAAVPEGTWSLLAVYHGKYVGCVDFHLRDKTSYQLRNLYVRPEIRKHGVGRLLIRGVLEQGAADGVRSLLIDISRIPPRTDSSGIMAFIQRNGFRPAATGQIVRYALC